MKLNFYNPNAIHNQWEYLQTILSDNHDKRQAAK